MSIEYVNPSELNDEESRRLEIGYVEPNEKLGALAAKQSGDIVVSVQLFSLPVNVIDSKGEGESCSFSVSSVHDEISPEELKKMIREVEEFLDRPRRIRLARMARLIRESETVVDDPTAHEPPVFHEYI